MSDKQSESLPDNLAVAAIEVRERREFLRSLGKWSKAVIGGALLGGALAPGQEAEAWSGGPGGGAGVWYNSGRGWGGWVEGPWNWYNRPRWYNRPYWRDHGWYDRPWHNRPWYNGGGWYDGWYNR